MDRGRASEIVRLRALGYSQSDIASQLHVSQQTVSRYLRGINEAAEEHGDLEQFLWLLLLGAMGYALFKAFKK